MQLANVQVGTPHPVLRFHLLYHGLRKQAGQLLKISMVGPGEKRKMTVWDRRSGRSFVVDCGAHESLFPASDAEKRPCLLSSPTHCQQFTHQMYGANMKHPLCSVRDIPSHRSFKWQMSQTPSSVMFFFVASNQLICLTSVTLILMTSTWLQLVL